MQGIDAYFTPKESVLLAAILGISCGGNGTLTEAWEGIVGELDDDQRDIVTEMTIILYDMTGGIPLDDIYEQVLENLGIEE